MAVFTDLSETDCAEIANVFRLGHLTSVIGIADGDRETTFLFRAEHGILSAEMSDLIYDRLGRVAPVIEIPVAGHHVMLDQPIALVAALRTLLSDWDHSRPEPRP